MRFYSLDKLINLHDGYKKVIKIDEHHLLLVQLNGERHLIESMCPHRGHPLTESDLNAESGRIRCPLHAYQFDIVSGDLLHATEEHCRSLKTYDLIYEGNEVGVML